MENFKEQQKEWDIKEAKSELTQLKALKILAKDNNLACTIEIAGLSFGLCDNSKILPLIEFQEQEIKKFLNSEVNLWE